MERDSKFLQYSADMSSGPWGVAIRRLRKAKSAETKEKWTKTRVAELSGMTPTTYGRVEAGEHTQTRKLEDIANALGVPITAVLCEPTQTKFATAPLERDTKEVIKSSHDRINYDSMRQGTTDEPTQEAYATVHPVILAHLEAISASIQALGDISELIGRLEAVNTAITQRATTWAMAPADKKRSTATLVESAGRSGVSGKREPKPRRKNR